MRVFSPVKIVLFFFILVVDVIQLQGQKPLFTLSDTFNDLKANLTCMVITPDKKFVVAGDASGEIMFRDAESGKLVSVLKAFESSVACVSFNSTGKLMVTATHDGEIKIYDFLQKKIIHSLYSPEYVDLHFALFSIADGFIYFNGQGRLYKTRSDLSQVPVKIYEFDAIISNALISNDRSALIFTCGNSIKVLNTRTDQLIQEIADSPKSIEQMEWSGNKLVTWSQDGVINFHQYELNQLNVVPLLWFRAGTSGKLAFSGDGNLMVTGNTGTWARVWKPFEKNVVQELFGHRSAVTNFVFGNNDQALFTSANDSTIKVWKQHLEKPDVKKVVAETSMKKIETPPDVSSDTMKLSSIITGTDEKTMPVIELGHENIPAYVGGRKVDKTTVVEINQPDIDIYIFDNSTLDGDIMSLSFNNQWIMTHYIVTKKKRKISLQLTPDSNNYLILFADNLGKTPPNTAVISFSEQGREKIFRLESDLKTCSAINFVYRKKKSPE